MDKTALVSVEIEKGAELLDALDRAEVPVSIALWANLSEYGDWRFILADRHFDVPDPRTAYGSLHEPLSSAGLTPRNTPPILILPTSDSFIRELRRKYRKAKPQGARISGQLIGDRFVEDAYIYRVL